MRRRLTIILLLGILLLSVGCSAPPIVQGDEPQDGQYYDLGYVLDKSKAKIYFYGTEIPTILYAVEIAYTGGGILSVGGYFTSKPYNLGKSFLYTDEVRTFGGSWEVREVIKLKEENGDGF